jgi:hypothetical protein
MSGLWAKYVSQISINTTTYHHSRFLKIIPRFEFLERRIVFHTTELHTININTTSKRANERPLRSERDRTCAETRSALCLRKMQCCVMHRCVECSRHCSLEVLGRQVQGVGIQHRLPSIVIHQYRSPIMIDLLTFTLIHEYR